MFGRNRIAKRSNSMRPVAAFTSLARRPGQRFTSRIAVQLAVLVGLSAVALFAASGSATADDTFTETTSNTESNSDSKKNDSGFGLVQEVTGTVDRTTNSVTNTVSEITHGSNSDGSDFEIRSLAKTSDSKNSAPAERNHNTAADDRTVGTGKNSSDSALEAAETRNLDRTASNQPSEAGAARGKADKKSDATEESVTAPQRRDQLKKSQISANSTSGTDRSDKTASDDKASGTTGSDKSAAANAHVSTAKSAPTTVSDRNDHKAISKTTGGNDSAPDQSPTHSALDLATDIVSDIALGGSRPSSEHSDREGAVEGADVVRGEHRTGGSGADSPAKHAASVEATSAKVTEHRGSTPTDDRSDLASTGNGGTANAAPESEAQTVHSLGSTDSATPESEAPEVDGADLSATDVESAGGELDASSLADTDSEAGDSAEADDEARASLLDGVVDLVSQQPVHSFAERSADLPSSTDRHSTTGRHSAADRGTVEELQVTTHAAPEANSSGQPGLLSILGIDTAGTKSQRDLSARSRNVVGGADDTADVSRVAKRSTSAATDRPAGDDSSRQGTRGSSALPELAPLLGQVVSPLLDQTVTPVLDQTVSPLLDQTVTPVLDQTVSPVLDQTVTPVLDQTVSPVLDQTVTPVLDQTVSPVLDQTVTPIVEETVAPVLNETVAPVTGPVVNTIVAPLSTATAPVTSTVDKVAGTTLATVTSLTAPVVDPVGSAVEPTVESGLQVLTVTVAPLRSAQQPVISDLDQQTTYLQPTSANATADVTIRTTSSPFAFEPTTPSIDQHMTAIRSLDADDASRSVPTHGLADQTLSPSATGSAGAVRPDADNAADRSDVTSAGQPFEPVHVPAQQFTDAALPSLSGGSGSGSGGSITGSGGAPATAGVAVGFLSQPRLAQCGMSHPESTDLPTGPTFGPGCFPD